MQKKKRMRALIVRAHAVLIAYNRIKRAHEKESINMADQEELFSEFVFLFSKC